MTSTAGTTQHPDVAEISDLAEGLLSASRTEAVRRHLDGCALCADVELCLEEIRGLLGTLPGPPRMPADIAGRIDAALAAEALLNSTAPDLTPAAPDDIDAPHPVREATQDVSRETSAGVPRQVSPAVDRPAGHARAATGPGRASPVRRQRRRAVWGAVLGVAALGMGVLLLQPSAPSKDGASKSDAASVKSQTFSGSPIKGQVETLLAAQPEGLKTPREKNAPSLDIQETPPSPKQSFDVPPCVQLGTGREEAPLGSESGTYDGKPAFLLVLPHASDTSSVQAYVVDAACTTKAPGGKGELLLTQAYPRR
ncbi:hypothetical protein [Streptomyces sp. NPDC051561]|uniref:hypothetical protein n=1 Tax=Streptomyces sp. NPDC051561 TaxID=3365658 RepID=UPI0037AB1AAE